jgi:acyl carrier protein
MATQEEILAGIVVIIEEVTGIEASEVTFDESLVDDLDLDSLSMAEGRRESRGPVRREDPG